MSNLNNNNSDPSNKLSGLVTTLNGHQVDLQILQTYFNQRELIQLLGKLITNIIFVQASHLFVSKEWTLPWMKTTHLTKGSAPRIPRRRAGENRDIPPETSGCGDVPPDCPFL